MNAPLAGFGPVFAWGAAHAVRWKKVLLVAGASVGLAALIGWQVGRSDDAAKVLAHVLDRGALAFGLPLIALLLAADGFAVEVSRRTLVYHLVRPVSRTTVFVARFLSGFLPATLVGFAFLAALVATSGVGLPLRGWLSLLVTSAGATLGLGAIFYVLSTLFRHGLVIGLIYAFVVEGFISSVPGTMQQFSTMFHVRSLQHGLVGDAIPPAPTRSVKNFIVSQLSPVEDTTPLTAAIVLVSVAVVVLAIGAWIVKHRDYGLRE